MRGADWRLDFTAFHSGYSLKAVGKRGLSPITLFGPKFLNDADASTE